MKEYTIIGTGLIGGFGYGTALDIHNYMENKGTDNLLIKADSTVVNRYVEPAKLRRVDHFCRMALTAACIAIEHAELSADLLVNCGLVVASGYGPVNSICSFKDSYFSNGAVGSSPTLFTKSVQNQTASTIATLCGLKGIVSTICQQSDPVESGLLTTLTWLEEERVERVLLVTVDELSPVLNYYNQRKNSREILGEGAAAILLEKGNDGIVFIKTDKLSKEEATAQLTKADLTENSLKTVTGSFPTVQMIGFMSEIGKMKAGEVKNIAFAEEKMFSNLLVGKRAES